jgi:predicted transcriptional regulator
MNMSILKAPPKQPKNATLQLRVDEELKLKLDKYAEFLESTVAYVVSEALKLVFSKDPEFKQWLESHATNSKNSGTLEASVTTESNKQPSGPVVTRPKANGNGLFR